MSLVEKNKGPGYKTSKYGMYSSILALVFLLRIVKRSQSFAPKIKDVWAVDLQTLQKSNRQYLVLSVM